MLSIRVFALTFLLSALSGCGLMECKQEETGAVMAGTSTAMVGLYIDSKGYPQPTVGTVVVAPGQRIVFTGPSRFDIVFKDKKSPVDAMELSAKDGVLILDIPKDVFVREDRRNPDNVGKDEIVYKYGIRVDGKLTDPVIIVRPR